MMNEEMITKAKEAKSVEELIALAKENGVELNEEDAKAYFAQFNPKSGALEDDELDAVAGGGCETKVDGKEYTVVTSPCKCFTGQYLCNYELRDGNWQLTDLIIGRQGSGGLKPADLMKEIINAEVALTPDLRVVSATAKNRKGG